MKNQNHYIAVGAAVGMLILILDGRTGLDGAREGIMLCLNTLFPSLFPFIFLSILLTGALSGQAIAPLRLLASVCKMPKGSESLLAVGFLGGYPVGAQSVALLERHGQLPNAHAMRMLAFCNNAGPAFIFGILGTMFSGRIVPLLLWLVHIASALVVGFLIPCTGTMCEITPRMKSVCITESLAQASKAMVSICGWVILMRMVLKFLEVWFLWMLPFPMQVVIAGILELSNGCIRLSDLSCEGLRFMIASGLLSFGGICVTLQTFSVTEGISRKLYFPGKILQCCISILLSCLLQYIFPPESRCYWVPAALISAVVAVFIAIILQYSKNNSRIPAAVGV